MERLALRLCAHYAADPSRGPKARLRTLLRRTPAAKTSYPIMLQNFEAAGFWRLVDDMDGEAGIFAGEGANNELASYGFITSAQTTADVRGISSVILEVESL